ncbi:oligopeptidase B [Catalinimonas alkaloidigena]|uniref:Proline-specific endopeptidase n=2 Tax=Catalinimonas alkaloidigena TaxID=1075417 RepID=A0A1G9R6R1_9BACT|nr:oligopeptidase B [Catalinimonas alkaloidigena]
MLTSACSDSPDKGTAQTLTPPRAEKVDTALTIHGHTRHDPYYWLNQRENPKVVQYLEAENAYTKEMLKDTEEMQEELYEEMVGRIKQNDASVPYPDHGYLYYSRYEEGREYPIFCRKKSEDAEEEILLNVNDLAQGHDYYQVVGLRVSPDNLTLAYGVDTVSRRRYTIHFKNLNTGETLPYALPNTTGSIAWANDSQTVFCTGKDSTTLRADRVIRYRLGEPSESAEEIYREDDETFSCYAVKTKSDKFLLIGSHSTLTTEFRYLDADTPQESFKVMQPRERGLEYYPDHYQNHFYIRTNLEAQNFRLMETPLHATAKENWKEVIPHRPDVLLEEIDVFRNWLVLQEKKEGLTQLRVRNQRTSAEHYLDFGEETYAASIGTNREFDTDWLRYEYSSLTTPNSTYDYHMQTKERLLRKQEEVLGNFDPNNYQAERRFAIARDGTRIPVSIVYRKGTPLDGSSPLLLYGYGSYGYGLSDSFSSSRLSLLDRGFVYAIAHIRGGDEMGRAWYENGKLLHKKNTFTDFIDCGEFLVQENYADSTRLFAAGGSAGGLLMGAVVNMRPDLFKGVIADVPFVDVVTTMLDESIPLTTSEYDEWGNPNDKAYYDYILSYSPYDNVAAKDYPALLVLTGLHDSQVQYWEPAKWVAKLRDLKTDQNPLLLHTNMSAGHGGASGRFERYRETAMEYAFLISLADAEKRKDIKLQ